MKTFVLPWNQFDDPTVVLWLVCTQPDPVSVVMFSNPSLKGAQVGLADGAPVAVAVAVAVEVAVEVAVAVEVGVEVAVAVAVEVAVEVGVAVAVEVAVGLGVCPPVIVSWPLVWVGTMEFTLSSI